MRRNRRHSLGIVALTGIGQAMIWSAIIPVLIVWWTIKVLAILAVALVDAGRAHHARRTAHHRAHHRAAQRPQAHYSNRR